jgi:hypothetical protein
LTFQTTDGIKVFCQKATPEEGSSGSLLPLPDNSFPPFKVTARFKNSTNGLFQIPNFIWERKNEKIIGVKSRSSVYERIDSLKIY